MWTHNMTAKEIKENNRKRLESKRNQLASGIDTTKNVQQMVDSFKALTKELDKSQKTMEAIIKTISNAKSPEVVASKVNLKPIADSIQDAFNSIDFRPVVNVAAPKVTVPKLDLQPLIDVMSEKETQVEVELEDFRAQDINNEEIGVQYIGFVHPSGAWYIIKNEVEENKMRYKFGKSDYEKHFAAPDTYEYTTLDRAIYEIQT